MPDSGPQRLEGNQKEDELNFNLKNFRFKRIANIIKKKKKKGCNYPCAERTQCSTLACYLNSFSCLWRSWRNTANKEEEERSCISFRIRGISVSLQIGCLLFWSVKKALQQLLSSVPVSDLYLLLWETATNYGQNRDTVLNCLKLKLFLFAIIIRTM